MKADKQRQVADVVAEQIERLVVDGVLKVGQALPSERRMGAKLGVSRSALREGLQLLRSRGIIETRQGSASRVARLSALPDSSPLLHLFAAQPETLYDLLEMRALLEGEAARLAAQRGTDADFVLIGRRYREMLAAHDHLDRHDDQDHAQLDYAFHLAIGDASHNPVLVHILQSLNELTLTSVFASVNNLYHRPERLKQIQRQHARVYHAVTQRLPVVAQRAARDHIHSLRDGFREIELQELRLDRATLRLEGWD